jgi:serine/threonine-protein kinase ATR
LYPKLLGLLTHATLSSVHEHVQKLLHLCLSVLARTSALWRPAAKVSQLYRSCVHCEYLTIYYHSFTYLY